MITRLYFAAWIPANGDLFGAPARWTLASSLEEARSRTPFEARERAVFAVGLEGMPRVLLAVVGRIAFRQASTPHGGRETVSAPLTDVGLSLVRDLVREGATQEFKVLWARCVDPETYDLLELL